MASFERRPFPSPADLASASTELYRAAGVSRQKERYLRDLARTLRRWTHLTPPVGPALTMIDPVREEITRVLGIGRWTADVFLLFWLARPDVLPADDLGIQKGVQTLLELPEHAGCGRGQRDRRALEAVSVDGGVVFVED